MARGQALSPTEDEDELADFEIPPAVVCAACGMATCSGCALPPKSFENSGIIRTTPWERELIDAPTGLWATVELVTLEGQEFFANLPKGLVSPAFRFAFAVELLAIGSSYFLWLPMLYVLAPTFVITVASVPVFRNFAIAVLFVGWPLVAIIMVGLHWVWGVSLELGIRLQKQPADLTVGSRYGLYTCGWDLITSPFGFVVALIQRGPSGARTALSSALSIPGVATQVYLREHRGLQSQDRRAVTRVATAVTGAIVFGGGLVLIALCVIGSLVYEFYGHMAY